MSAHVSWIDRVISFMFSRPSTPVTTDWQRKEQPAPTTGKQETPPAVPVYPFLPPKPYLQGDALRAYRETHPARPTRHTTTSLLQLPPEKLQEVVAKMPPRTIAPWQIANLPTAKSLDMSQVPEQVLGDFPVASGKLQGNQEIMARAHQTQTLRKPHLAPIPPSQTCTPLSTNQLPSWLLEEPPVPPKKPSGFLLASEVVLSEEEMKPDLSGEDPDATMQRPRVKKEG